MNQTKDGPSQVFVYSSLLMDAQRSQCHCYGPRLLVVTTIYFTDTNILLVLFELGAKKLNPFHIHAPLSSLVVRNARFLIILIIEPFLQTTLV